MKLFIDIDTGEVRRSLTGPVTTALSFTVRDLLPIELTYIQNGAEVTSTVLANNAVQKLTLRTKSYPNTLLALATTYNLAAEVASVLFDLNTQEFVDFLANEVSPDQRETDVIFEIEVSADDGTERETIHQSRVTARREMNQEGDEPPPTAAASAANATASAASAAASAAAAAGSASAAATSEGNSTTQAAAAAASAASAAASAAQAAQTLANQFLGGIAGNAVPATAAAAGAYYKITSAGTSQGKTWAIGDQAIYNGTSGSWTQVAGTLTFATTAEALADSDTVKAINAARMAERVNRAAMSRQVSETIFFDGSSGARAYLPLGTPGSLGSSRWTVPFLFRCPDANPSVLRLLWAFSNSSSGFSGGTWSMYLGVNAAGQLLVCLQDPSGANHRTLALSNFVTNYAGRWTAIHVTWDGSTAPALWINGLVQTMGETSGGTAPAWSTVIDSVYFLLGGGSSAQAWIGALIPTAPINSIFSSAEIIEHAQTGRLPTWCEMGTGSMVNRIASISRNSDFSALATDWVASATGTVSAASGALVITSAAANDGGVLASSFLTAGGFVPGRRYRLELNVTAISGLWSLYHGGSNEVIQTNWTGTGVKTWEFTVALSGSTQFPRILSPSGGNSITIGYARIYDLGPIIKPVVQAGRQIADLGANKIPGICTAGVTQLTNRDDGKLAQAALTANGEFVDTLGTLPLDAVLIDVVVKNNSANLVYGFAIGSASGQDDLSYRTDIPADGKPVTLPIKRTDLAGLTAGTTGFGRCYYSASSWNSGSLSIAIRYRRERDL